jgi:hypothetical protein
MMQHDALTQQDFERQPLWRFVDGWETVEPVMGSIGSEVHHDPMMLVAIEVTLPEGRTVPGYLLGDLRDPSALFLWATPTERLFLNGRPFPFEHVLQRIADVYQVEPEHLFPLAFRVPHLKPALTRHFTPRGSRSH